MNFGLGDITPFSSLLAFIGTLTGTILLGTLASRMLGIRQSWGRTLLVGFLGFATGATFSLTLQAENLPIYGRVFVFTSSITVSIMLLSVAFELLGRPRITRVARSERAGFPRPLRAARRLFARWARYLQITSIMARYGLAPYVRGRRSLPTTGPLGTGRAGGGIWARVRGALEEAGGAFIKLGQVLSTRQDILPPEAIAELIGLQDQVPTAPRQAVEALLAEELGDAPAKVFAEFDPQPLAAASIAQVYRARLMSGEQVIIKVQRPGIREPIERDLDIMLRMARTLEASASWARGFGVVDLAQGFAQALREEIDFRIEARNLATVAAAIDPPDAQKMRGPVRVPRLFPQLSTSRVLVIERFDGVSIRDAGPLLEELALDRAALARELLRCFLRQILRDGTFHADPHPGNIWVLRDGSLALLDFGSVGRLDPLQRAALQRMLIGLDRRDATMLSTALLDIAQKQMEIDEDRLERSLAQLMAQRLGPGMSPGPELFADLFALFIDFGLAFPPVVGGVFRALVTLQGTLAALAPDFQLIDEARAMGAEWVRATFSPTSLRKAATDELLTLLPLLQRLPRRLDRITAALEHGSLSANVRLFTDERDMHFLSRLVSRAVLAFLGAALGIMSVLFLGMQGGPALNSTISVYQVFGYAGLFLSSILILRVIIAIVREKTG
jgi:ubiquinone biosynthesis protein